MANQLTRAHESTRASLVGHLWDYPERPDAHARIGTTHERDDSPPVLLTCCSAPLFTFLPFLSLAHEKAKPRKINPYNWVGAALGGEPLPPVGRIEEDSQLVCLAL